MPFPDNINSTKYFGSELPLPCRSQFEGDIHKMHTASRSFEQPGFRDTGKCATVYQEHPGTPSFLDKISPAHCAPAGCTLFSKKWRRDAVLLSSGMKGELNTKPRVLVYTPGGRGVTGSGMKAAVGWFRDCLADWVRYGAGERSKQ